MDLCSSVIFVLANNFFCLTLLFYAQVCAGLNSGPGTLQPHLPILLSAGSMLTGISANKFDLPVTLNFPVARFSSCTPDIFLPAPQVKR